MPDQSLSTPVETQLAPVRAVGGVVFDEIQRTLSAGGRELRLEPKAGDLLAFLVAQQGQAVSREALLDEIWGAGGSDEALTQAISRLRRSLKELGGQPAAIETVPRVGYRLAEVGAAMPLRAVAAEFGPRTRYGLAFGAGALVGAAVMVLIMAVMFKPQVENHTILRDASGRIIASDGAPTPP